MQKPVRKGKRGMALLLAMFLMFSCFTMPSMATTSGYTYKDGVYNGSGSGHGGALSVLVTVESGKISNIEVGANNETPSYLAQAKAVIDDIINTQSTDVDAISGATKSSRAILEAVDSALEKAYSSIFDSGYGTEKSPFIIASLEQLQEFRNTVNQGQAYANQYIRLVSNIDISGREWIPINNFAGTFDGASHVISGLTIGTSSTPADSVNGGLFGTLSATAVVKNLGISNVAIYISNSAAAYAGGLAARTSSGSTAGGTIIDNCYVTGSRVSSETTANTIAFAGGLVGSLGSYSNITNCWTDISVEAKSGSTMSAYAGGLTSLAGNNITVANCYTLGEITATSANLTNGAIVGGLFGMQSGKSYNCYSLSSVTANNVTEAVYQTPKYSLAGALAGQVTGNGIMDRMFYSVDTAVTVNNAVYNPIPAVGIGASNTEPTSLYGLAGSSMISETLVDALNNGLKLLNQSNIILPSGVSMHAWELSGGKVTLSDKIYINDEIDSGIFAGGNGTVKNPYIIETEEQLRTFAVSLNEAVDYSGIYIKLAGDIDVNGEDWIPIGQGKYAFRGTFDGDGYKIKGLKYGSEENAKDATNDIYVALFGVIGTNGFVKNLGLVDVSIYNAGKNSVNSAAIAGYLEGGGIDNCYATGMISSKTTVKGNNFVGGLVANQYKGYIINSWADVDVRSEAVGQHLSEAGGLVSLNNRGLIANCYTLGNASGDAVRAAEGMAYVSNLVACQAGTIINCYVLGDTISDSYSYYVGAISGMTTGIGKGYLSYYNKEAVQTIDQQVPNPFVAVGTTINMTEDGITYSGFNYGLKGYTLAEMKSNDFALLLNSNFESFPVELSEWLPTGTTLKTWAYDNSKNLVTLTSDDAVTTYVPVVIEAEGDVTYKPGNYFGRAYNEGREIIVRIAVTEDEIETIEVTKHNEGDSFDTEDLIDAVLLEQGTKIHYDTNNSSLTAMLKAIDAALKKAEVGDTTGYGKVDPAIFAGGTGKETNPYQISSVQELIAFAASINVDEGYEGAYIVLTKDISLKGIDWIPTGSGNAAYPFRGSFDGAGHTISDMTIGSEGEPMTYQYVGLFGYGNRAQIKNVNLTNAYINNYYKGNGRAYAGVLAGAVENGTYIANCSAQGILTNRSKNQCYTGGLVSFTSGTDSAVGYVINCYTNVDITGISDSSWVYLGGISGLNNRTYIINCYTLGDAASDSTVNVNKTSTGGIAGFQAGYVRNCYALGNVKSVLSATDVGGYAGRHTGIATTYYAYYNTDAIHYSGNTLLKPTPGVGVYVPSSSTGLVTAVSVEGKMKNYLKSAEFAAVLNQNMTDENVMNVLPDDIALKSWVYDQALDLVVFAKDSNDPDNGSGGSRGSRGSSSNTSEGTASEPTKTADSALKEALEKTGEARLKLESGQATLTAETLQDINSTNSIIMEGAGVRVEFPKKSLFSDDLLKSAPGVDTHVDIVMKSLDDAKQKELLSKANLGESTGIFEIGGLVFELTAEIVSIDGADNITRTRISSFSEPVKIAIDLSSVNMNQVDVTKLTAVRYVTDAAGNVTLVKLGGSYDPQTKEFSFYTDSFSYYGVLKADNLIYISLSIGEPSVTVNGAQKTLDVPAVIMNDRTMVPLRFIAETLQAHVEWKEVTRSVEITKDGKKIELVLGKTGPGLDVPAIVQDGRTLVPLRYVVEALEANVLWHPSLHRVDIVN
ncbi:stalk domain-containing protein [Geosporobacter ferrireducens]|uniref:stalk domain-containing protein n=1 Tax=Geosporobacter ferrireducens TaxID=1424294 RepID=UPI00139F06E5|nr:stalk domain-containing protein [Geosporobacter ferrireducens]MTI55673.1 FMN-binding protein [Geosporobacter ferrireducens]